MYITTVPILNKGFTNYENPSRNCIYHFCTVLLILKNIFTIYINNPIISSLLVVKLNNPILKLCLLYYLFQSAIATSKCDKILLQSASGISKCVRYFKVRQHFTSKCDSYFKVWQLLQKCDSTHVTLFVFILTPCNDFLF